MNVLDQLTIKKTPFIFEYEPQQIVMSCREIGVLPALISELVGMSIDKVEPIEKVGRVMMFDVTPYKKIDPPLIYCRDVDLKEYYFIWSMVANKSTISRNKLLWLYEEMIATLNVNKLQVEEAAFLLIELLKFKNEYVRRA